MILKNSSNHQHHILLSPSFQINLFIYFKIIKYFINLFKMKYHLYLYNQLIKIEFLCYTN